MCAHLRIATWNLQRPKAGSWKHKPVVLEKIREINADIWVLTETNQVINPGQPYTAVSSTPIPDYHSAGETCSTIWSRHPFERVDLPTFDPAVAVCAVVKSPAGSLLVYGTIITWRDDGVAEGQASAWERHYLAIQKHQEDWAKLRSQGLPLCIAGDFNESLNKPFAYGSARGRELLHLALQTNALVCVTAEEALGYNIDHICLSKNLTSRVRADTWNQHSCLNSDGNPVSDHNGVFVDLWFD